MAPHQRTGPEGHFFVLIPGLGSALEERESDLRLDVGLREDRVAACCMIELRVRSAVSSATSTSRIRLSDAECSALHLDASQGAHLFCCAPRAPPAPLTVSIAVSIAASEDWRR